MLVPRDEICYASRHPSPPGVSRGQEPPTRSKKSAPLYIERRCEKKKESRSAADPIQAAAINSTKMPKFKLATLYDEVLKRQENSKSSTFYNVHAERALILRERQAAVLLQKWVKAYPLARAKRRGAKVGG